MAQSDEVKCRWEMLAKLRLLINTERYERGKQGLKATAQECKPHDEALFYYSTSSDNSYEFTAQQGPLAHRQHVQGSRKHGVIIFLQKNVRGVGTSFALSFL